jgi:hypothetical protein
MTTPVISIIFFVFAAFLGALGQYLYKSLPASPATSR